MKRNFVSEEGFIGSGCKPNILRTNGKSLNRNKLITHFFNRTQTLNVKKNHKNALIKYC